MAPIPQVVSQNSSLQTFHISVTHEGGFAPIKLLDGVGLAVINLDFSVDETYWNTNHGNLSQIEGQIDLSGVPAGVEIKSYPEKDDFPIPFTMDLYPEDDRIGSWKTEMWIFNINAAYGLHEVTLTANITSPSGLPNSFDSTTFQLSIQQVIPGFSPISIITGIIVAATVILIFHERRNLHLPTKAKTL
jgi:hypothetical protein